MLHQIHFQIRDPKKKKPKRKNTMRAPSLFFLATLLVHISVQCNATDSQLGSEKVTNLHFYLHDTLGGKDPTAVPVARGDGATPGPGNPAPFSSVYVADDVLTEGPERQSRVVGNAQGLYVSSGKGELSLVLGMDFELTDGPFGGSSFVVFSRNPVSRGDGRELAVVGGRGVFRMARGFALLRTHYLDTGNGDAIIEYNVTLLHY
ncbi:dirigent protein 15-like [Oryza brachyantha]|uniref:dirigent protein 15-like n=1 Tax=Oryza brachyantha TaxID=4533 RepID=UPI001ADBE2AB|nr:dirigent protein 15-like [Oryza brachyantha]